MNPARKADVVLGVLLASTLACGSSGPPVATITSPGTDIPSASGTSAAVPIGAVGDRVENGGIALTVNNVTFDDEIDNFLSAASGNIYLVLDVTIENTDDDEGTYNLLYFKVKDADGYEYSASISAPEPNLSAGDLVAGDKVRGNVAFEVKEDATGIILTYEPLVLFGDDASIRVNLGDVTGD